MKVVFLIKFLKEFGKNFRRNEILLFAQGLTLNTILTLIPILGLILSISSLFVKEEELIYRSLVWFANYLTPEATSKVIEKILKLVEKVQDFPLGKFSIFAYFFMSLGLFFQLEDALNKIFFTSKKRTFFQRIAFYWFCITVTPIIFLIPVFLHTFAKKFSWLLFLLLLIFIFFLMYIYFPARKISKKSAIVGASFSSIIWILSSLGYSLYVKHAVSYSKIYGSLSAVLLFLLWIFINWCIFLIGAEISSLLEKKIWKHIDFKLPYSWTKIYILYLLGKAFYEGREISLETLEELVKIGPLTLEKLLEDLEKKKFIYLLEDKILLAKSPEKIYLSELLELENPSILPPCQEAEDLFQKLKILFFSLTKTSLRDLL
ncbi:MAG: YihY/virulence factor BrkB family protein [Thermodesulfobacteriaceae bacterium]|nr:YihY/virulence factor BrkB family protein [Thermodesulfobacteriaceae bacterium]